jgi:peptidoglycan/xylan/chitin deacetylase (PgdA/CDA1 family)
VLYDPWRSASGGSPTRHLQHAREECPLVKISLLSMDLEDWHDLKYLEPKVRSRELSMADGVSRFLEVLERHRAQATFFVLGSFWRAHRDLVCEIARAGHEIGLHGADHRLLYEVSDQEFVTITSRAKTEIEEGIGQPVEGFRASCFSMTPTKLRALQKLGFRYDASFIRAAMEYRGRPLDFEGWTALSTDVFAQDGFVEFGLTTTRVLGRILSIGGGGYFRTFPWPLFKRLLLRELEHRSVYTFYLHPFETSAGKLTSAFVDWGPKDRFRFQVGRSAVLSKLEKLASLLAEHGYDAMSHRRARRLLLADA